MKVIHIISGGDTGGAKTHVLSIVSRLNKHIEAVIVCFMEGEFSSEAKALGIPTLVFGGSFIKSLGRLSKFIRREGFDIVHCHGSRGNLAGAFLRFATGIPVVSTVHSDYRLDYLGRPLARLTYGNINAISLRLLNYYVGVTSSMRERLISRGFNPGRVFVIYNGIDFDRIPPPANRADYWRRVGLNADENSVVVGIAARLDPVKDAETLIRGFAKAYAMTPQLRLLIAGDGQERNRLTELTRSLGVEPVVCFAGWQSDMDAFYSSIDINTLTSISETFPYAITEGALHHLPTVSTRVGGIPDLIKHGETGLLIEPGDHDALSEHLSALAADKELRRALGDSIFQKSSDEFSMRASSEKQLEIYREILERQAAGSPKRSGVLICGAYGHGNAGDEAILEAIITEMRSIDPDMPLTVLSRHPDDVRVKFGINALHTFNFPGFLRVMRRTRLYINGGGSLIQDVTSRRSLWYYLFSIAAAKTLGCSVMMYGCGIGPVDRSYNRRLVKRVLNRYVDVITLRERSSFEELRQFGVTRPEIILSSDPALSLPAAEPEIVDAVMTSSGLNPAGDYICFTLRRWRDFKNRAGAFASAAANAYHKHGLTPVFLSINHRNDGDASDYTASLLNGIPHHILRDPMPSELTIGLLSRMRVVVSMRLHALIFAAHSAVPTVGVSYDPKVKAFLDYMGNDLYVDFSELDEAVLIKLVDTALESTPDPVRSAELFRNESRNVEAAKTLLENGY